VQALPELAGVEVRQGARRPAAREKGLEGADGRVARLAVCEAGND